LTDLCHPPPRFARHFNLALRTFERGLGAGVMTMTVVRGLLSLGNSKLGSAIHHWGITAVETCPGSTRTCRAACYATKSRYLLPGVRERLRWNLEQAQADSFVDRMCHEIRLKGCLVVRVHSSGDYFDAAYAGRWLAVMRKCPKPRYYWYSRSWAVPEVARVLEEMARLGQVRCWYSIDKDTGIPGRVPPGVRLAYLQTQDGEQPEPADLLFRVRRLRRQRVPLSVACPSETPQGREVTCGSCRRCFD
jgi:hypothetical protein